MDVARMLADMPLEPERRGNPSLDLKSGESRRDDIDDLARAIRRSSVLDGLDVPRCRVDMDRPAGGLRRRRASREHSGDQSGGDVTAAGCSEAHAGCFLPPGASFRVSDVSEHRFHATELLREPCRLGVEVVPGLATQSAAATRSVSTSGDSAVSAPSDVSGMPMTMASWAAIARATAALWVVAIWSFPAPARRAAMAASRTAPGVERESPITRTVPRVLLAPPGDGRGR